MYLAKRRPKRRQEGRTAWARGWGRGGAGSSRRREVLGAKSARCTCQQEGQDRLRPLKAPYIGEALDGEVKWCDYAKMRLTR